MAFDPASMGVELGMSLLSGLFGQQPSVPGYITNAGHRAMGVGKQFEAFSKTLPMSTPQERSALDQAQGLQGNRLAQQYQGLLASLGPGGPNGVNMPGAADALGRFQSNASGQFGSNEMAALIASLTARRKALADAGSIYGNVAGLQPHPIGPTTDLGSSFGNLAQQYSFMQAMGQHDAPGVGSNFFRATAPPSGSFYGPGGQDWGEGAPPISGVLERGPAGVYGPQAGAPPMYGPPGYVSSSGGYYPGKP